ncbi:hypothetical protein D1007_20193 [Hordeum vulgare]|nr:hypothetical protein D1007_20193 [Hordeum vulgare]
MEDLQAMPTLEALEAGMAVPHGVVLKSTTEEDLEPPCTASKCGVTGPQEAHAKHVSEVNAKLDATEKEIHDNVDAKVAADRIASSSLDLTSCKSVDSILREKFEFPLAASYTGYVEISSKIMVQLEEATRKVDGILEEERRNLFSIASTCVFTHLLLRTLASNLVK